MLKRVVTGLRLSQEVPLLLIILLTGHYAPRRDAQYNCFRGDILRDDRASADDGPLADFDAGYEGCAATYCRIAAYRDTGNLRGWRVPVVRDGDVGTYEDVGADDRARREVGAGLDVAVGADLDIAVDYCVCAYPGAVADFGLFSYENPMTGLDSVADLGAFIDYRARPYHTVDTNQRAFTYIIKRLEGRFFTHI